MGKRTRPQGETIHRSSLETAFGLAVISVAERAHLIFCSRSLFLDMLLLNVLIERHAYVHSELTYQTPLYTYCTFS